MKLIIKLLIVMMTVGLTSVFAWSQTEENTVTLVVSGEASTKEEAVKQALRSAIEQAFGAFVSANTEVLNDEIIRDEIVTVSTGNILDYKEISNLKNEDGKHNVTLEATVSISKLTNFARSKGMSVELSSGAFAMNMKIRELNKENEIKAIKELQFLLRKMGKEYNYFDYNLELSEPYVAGNDKYAVTAVVKIIPNANLAIFRNSIISVLKSLSLSDAEQAEYERAKIPLTRFAVSDYNSDEEMLNSMLMSGANKRKNTKHSIIALRNTDELYPLLYFPVLFMNNQLKCSLEDNTGNYFGFMYFVDNTNNELTAPYIAARSCSPVWPVHDFDPKFRGKGVEHYIYSLGSTGGFPNLLKAKLYGLNDMFDFTLEDSTDPLGNPMIEGPAELRYELIFHKDHFMKINNINVKFRRPQYYENN